MCSGDGLYGLYESFRRSHWLDVMILIDCGLIAQSEGDHWSVFKVKGPALVGGQKIAGK
jgi:hypothetical protein